MESSDVFVSAVLSNDETAFCRINAARREVRSGGELHKGPPQQHRHQPRQRERDPCVSGRWVLPDMGVQGDVRQPSRVVSLNTGDVMSLEATVSKLEDSRSTHHLQNTGSPVVIVIHFQLSNSNLGRVWDQSKQNEATSNSTEEA